VTLKARKSLMPFSFTENPSSINKVTNDKSNLLNNNNFLKNKLSLKKWMDTDYDVISTMKEEIQALRSLFGKRISQELLQQIEDRYIVFLEDGADIQ
jgi:predicted ABC-class ATPase